jgi:phosphatidylserine/phosphatidylglycerophosphate/cardiolipin synthase-like enzyme
MSDATNILSSLPAEQLDSLAQALQHRRLSLASSTPALAAYVGGGAASVSAAFQDLGREGFTDAQAALVLRVAQSCRARERPDHVVADLVLSGPDVPGIPTSATDAVVHCLFLEAKREIILAGYAFHHARHILEPLANRLQNSPAIQVILHVDISRGSNDTSTSENIVLRFAQDFWKRHWPWETRPEVWFDPRALSQDRSQRACLHAKCIAIDREKVLVTSANFTEAAQERNIEAGILLRSPERAAQLVAYFEAMRNNGTLRALPH